MADYLVLNDTRKKGRSVSRNFKKYQFYEKENKPNSMKCGSKTNKNLTAVKETGHTITTSEGRIIHKKLVSKPLLFQTSRKTDEQRRAISRYRRCGKFSSGEICETHQRQNSNNNAADNEPSTSHALPTMPMKKKRDHYRVVMYDSSSRESDLTDASVDEDSSDTEDDPEETNLRAEIGREIERLRDQTPTLTSPIGCSTELANNPPQSDHSGTQIHRQDVDDTTETGEEPTGKLRPEQKINIGKKSNKI